MTKATGKSRKREQAIAALLSTSTVAEAAAQCRLSVRTLQRWLAEPEFAKQFSQAKAGLLRDATTQLLRESTGAVTTLAAVSKDADAPTGARVQAAARIIELAATSFKTEELERRLTALEAALVEE